MSLPEPGPSSAPLSVKLKLNNPTPNSPHTTQPQLNTFDTPLKQEHSTSTSAFSSTPLAPPNFTNTPTTTRADSPAPGSVSSPAGLDPNGQPIKKRRRTVKKGPNDMVQPGGKGWRKGVKGVIVAGQPLPPRDPNVPIVVNNGGGQSSFRGFAAAQSIAPAKTPAGYLAPQVLEKRTPKPREWSLGLCEFASITGKPLKLTSWKGASNSPYRAAIHPAPPPLPPTLVPSQPDTAAPTPSAQPHPLSVPIFPSAAPSTSASTSPDPSGLPTSQEPSPAPLQQAEPASVPITTMEGMEQA